MAAAVSSSAPGTSASTSATVGNLLASAEANCTGGLSLYKYTAAYGSESVTVTATDTVAGAAGTAICSTLTGFRPGVIQGRGIVGSAVNASSGLPSVHGVYSDGAALNIATTADSANNVLASLSYTTNDSWPTALPGNAIGTIPQ